MPGMVYGTPVMSELLPTLLREPADVLHANFPSPYVASATALAARLRKKPAVLTWHNDLPPVTLTASVLVALHDRLILPGYLQWFRKVIATSEVYAHTSRNLERIKAKVTVIPNGVDTHRFNPKVSGGDITAKLGLEGCKVVLFVGALTKWHRYKGLDVLLRAFSLIDDSRFRLVVVGDGILMSEYKQMATALFISDRVIFAGDVPDFDLPKYYACSDLLVLPSKDRSEGFGLTLLEANASGKPVIGTSVGGILSVIRDGFNGILVPPNDPETLACKLKELLCGPDRRLIEMGMNGRMFAKNLDWSVVAERTEKVYESVLSS